MAIFLPFLKQTDRLNSLHITVCNVGSRKLGEDDDYGSFGWEIFAPNLTIYGFDADPDACDEANTNLEERGINWDEIHIPVGLGKEVGDAKLYVTKSLMCSSLYPPNEKYLSRFSFLPEFMSLDFEIPIEVITLDHFCQTEDIGEIDFLQVDVQGADLDVLKGASWILDKSILAIQIEVEFSHLYQGQPLFADVDTFLRAKGFSLFDLTTLRRVRKFSPIQSNAHPGQILWGDGFYFRDLIRQDIDSLPKTPEQIFKLACIADAMEFGDYALELFKYLTLDYGEDPLYNFADVIVDGLSQFPNIVSQDVSSLPIFAGLEKYVSKS
jgi:FkbM family methyltransferase